jgi:hypothetical protein
MRKLRFMKGVLIVTQSACRSASSSTKPVRFDGPTKSAVRLIIVVSNGVAATTAAAWLLLVHGKAALQIAVKAGTAHYLHGRVQKVV